eukprot:TRINITY_DN6093_c0_g1_i1.p2 TRINITY_DN6093_c0_g1~~TRINITY_DN6093_c0_g1_i1.p2  ORF type:complete len:159 (-),score=32.83 TRINITY_DN6093_c0_g1_i1:599-1075(-)
MKPVKKLTEPWRVQCEARWADCDPAFHMRHSAYADWSTHSRFSYFTAMDFKASKMAMNGYAPVIFEEKTKYFKEISLGEMFWVTFEMAAYSPDISRFVMRHHIYKKGDVLAAIHEVTGGWLDVFQRKIRDAPPEMTEMLGTLTTTSDFKVLPSPTAKL